MCLPRNTWNLVYGMRMDMCKTERTVYASRTCKTEGFLPDDSHIDEASFPYCLHAYRMGTLLASPCANGCSNVDQVAPCALGHSLHSMPAGSRAVYMLSSGGSLQSVEPCERAYISPTASRGSFLLGSNHAA